MSVFLPAPSTLSHYICFPEFVTEVNFYFIENDHAMGHYAEN